MTILQDSKIVRSFRPQGEGLGCPESHGGAT